MKKKFAIEQLKVLSFVTSDSKIINTIQARGGASCDVPDADCQPCQSSCPPPM